MEKNGGTSGVVVLCTVNGGQWRDRRKCTVDGDADENPRTGWKGRKDDSVTVPWRVLTEQLPIYFELNAPPEFGLSTVQITKLSQPFPARKTPSVLNYAEDPDKSDRSISFKILGGVYARFRVGNSRAINFRWNISPLVRVCVRL